MSTKKITIEHIHELYEVLKEIYMSDTSGFFTINDTDVTIKVENYNGLKNQDKFSA